MPLLERLDDDIDDIEEILEPMLSQSLSKLSKNLPVMDKAKIYVLITYTLESLIFSMLDPSLSFQFVLCLTYSPKIIYASEAWMRRSILYSGK